MMNRKAGLAVVVLTACMTASPDARGTIIAVRSGGDLQAAIDRARPGDTILLGAGTYSGNFTLPPKEGEEYITIRTAPRGLELSAGGRVTPEQAKGFAKLSSASGGPVLRTLPGAHHWRLQLLEFLPTAQGGDIILLGDGGVAQSEAGTVPHHLVIDRCYIHGDPAKAQKRGIALNSASTVITNSYIADLKAAGQDSQAIAGWNGPGPYLIENNYLEAAGENFLLGGADPRIPGLVPEDITVRRNHFAKRAEWRDTRWLVKNLFELKNAKRVLVEGNLLEHSWKDGQTGFAVLLTPRNSGGRAPWVRVEDVVFRYNLVRSTGAGINILGEDNTDPSGPARRLEIVHNLFYDVDHRWGGNGAFLMIGGGPSEVVVEHNTVRQSGNIVMAYGGSRNNPDQVPGFVFRANIVNHNEYGVHGQSRAVGRDTLDAYFPDAIFTGNVIGGGEARRYPGGNRFTTERELDESFMNAAAQDYRLRPTSPFLATGQGSSPGADIPAIMKLVGVRPPP